MNIQKTQICQKIDIQLIKHDYYNPIQENHIWNEMNLVVKDVHDYVYLLKSTNLCKLMHKTAQAAPFFLEIHI